MSSLSPVRSLRDLTESERRALEVVHAELRAAVSAYEVFLGQSIQPGADVSTFEADETRLAQERVEAAERALWDLRERLLGWARPAWAPSATLVADWILEEDPGYDDISDSTGQ